jgi:hypothetical protein
VDRIYILGVSWKIEWVDTLHDFGDCDPNQRLIRIKQHQTTEQLVETIFHEIGHAAWSMTGCEEKEREEPAVHRIAVGLASFWCDCRNDSWIDEHLP